MIGGSAAADTARNTQHTTVLLLYQCSAYRQQTDRVMSERAQRSLGASALQEEDAVLLALHLP